MVTGLRAIAEPKRFEIVECLRDGPLSVNEIVSRLGLGQPQISKHLKVLSDAGLVERTTKAQMRIYSLKREPFDELAGWVASFRNLWSERLDSLDSFLQELRKDENRTTR